MSTRSTITTKIGNKYHSVYCHFDGYCSGVGKTLLNHYNSQALAEKVVALGDLSSLEESMDAPEGHTFNKPMDGYSVAYHRDRGDKLEQCQPYITESLLEVYLAKEQYNYLWDGEKWLVDDIILDEAMCNVRL